MCINKWHITFFETKTEGIPSCDIHIAPTPSQREAQCCVSQGRGGRKCPEEQPGVPDSSPGSLANVARWARGVGSGLPRGPATGVQVILQSWAWAEVGCPGSRHGNAESGRCQCPSRAVGPLGIAPASPSVPAHGAHGHTGRALARTCSHICSPAPHLGTKVASPRKLSPSQTLTHCHQVRAHLIK